MQSGLAATITLAEGHVTAQGHTARSRGVTVTVRALFAASPARLALLRGPRTETAQAFAIVRAYALIHPAVRFTFVADGALVFSTPGTTLADAAQADLRRDHRAHAADDRRSLHRRGSAPQRSHRLARDTFRQPRARHAGGEWTPRSRTARCFRA